MARIQMIDPSEATGKGKELLDAVHNKLKIVPNLAKALANSPAALEAWINLNRSLEAGALDAKTREAIALTVAQKNGCEYCLSAHTTIGRLVGLSETEIIGSREGRGSSVKTTAALQFARELVERRGQVPASSIEELRSHGVTEGEIAEIVAHVALNIFTNYFNIALDVDVDFPRVALNQAA
jgi:uncharacterized peroxidase-related enzyme